MKQANIKHEALQNVLMLNSTRVTRNLSYLGWFI
jgi:hypothetical protein